MFLQTISAVQRLNFPGSKTGQPSKTLFPFHESSVVSEQTVLGCVFSDANSPSDIPQSPFTINGAYSEVKISWEPIFK